jgi:hypothetical protein
MQPHRSPFSSLLQLLLAKLDHKESPDPPRKKNRSDRHHEALERSKHTHQHIKTASLVYKEREKLKALLHTWERVGGLIGGTYWGSNPQLISATNLP